MPIYEYIRVPVIYIRKKKILHFMKCRPEIVTIHLKIVSINFEVNLILLERAISSKFIEKV